MSSRFLSAVCRIVPFSGFVPVNVRNADYSLKYYNELVPLEPRDEVKVLMFKLVRCCVICHLLVRPLLVVVDCRFAVVLTDPGQITARQTGILPTDGYDSHSSPNHLEWFLLNRCVFQRTF